LDDIKKNASNGDRKMHKPFQPAITKKNTFLLISMLLGLSIPANASNIVITTPPWLFHRAEPSVEKSANVVVEDDENESKLKALADHDVVVLIDHSGSMKTADCPEGDGNISESKESRWQWCCDQTKSLARQTKNILKKGIKVVVFSTLQKVYEDVHLDRIASIFETNQPDGSTHVAAAIKRELDDYFYRRSRPESQDGPIKPLLIAVVTDGDFESSAPIQHAITDATKRMTSPDEIAITFLQVGHDKHASEVLKTLECSRSHIGRMADYDIVSTRSFSEVSKTGLTDTLLDVVASQKMKSSG
jgi:hypothetical protein